MAPLKFGLHTLKELASKSPERGGLVNGNDDVVVSVGDLPKETVLRLLAEAETSSTCSLTGAVSARLFCPVYGALISRIMMYST
mmetsp:Transcript_8596/g.12277  ORF Transcript_8596/g.12277 Transcript_8596/m.12277 type:complete len:84 (+) Transcript_8596:63-314(+)